MQVMLPSEQYFGKFEAFFFILRSHAYRRYCF